MVVCCSEGWLGGMGFACTYMMLQLRGLTYTAPARWMKGKGRVTLQVCEPVFHDESILVVAMGHAGRMLDHRFVTLRMC